MRLPSGLGGDRLPFSRSQRPSGTILAKALGYSVKPFMVRTNAETLVPVSAEEVVASGPSLTTAHQSLITPIARHRKHIKITCHGTEQTEPSG